MLNKFITDEWPQNDSVSINGWRLVSETASANQHISRPPSPLWGGADVDGGGVAWMAALYSHSASVTTSAEN